MTSSARCDFPGCEEVTMNYEIFFKKWACAAHDFDVVVWPGLGNEGRVEANMKAREVFKNDPTMRTRKKSFGKWGKKYY